MPSQGARTSARPGLEQLPDDGIELLFRRIPGLHQVVVERHLIDAGDGRLGVGVGGQQHLLRFRVDLARLGQELRARHAGHALIDQEQSAPGSPRCFSLRAASSPSAPDAAVMIRIVAEAAAEVQRDGVQHLRFVVDGEGSRACGRPPLPAWTPFLRVARIGHEGPHCS
jgi:hypothetical protein